MKIKKNNSKKFILLIIVVATYVGLFLDAYKYSGFVKTHFIIDPLLLFAVSVLLLILEREKSKNIFKINQILFPIFLVVYLVFEFLEARFYPNYIFSHIHVQPQNFLNVVLFCGTLLIVRKIKLNQNQIANKLNVKSFTIFVLFITSIIALTTSISQTFNLAINFNFLILNHLDYNYDDKMREHWGLYYDYMKFVRDNTPENSKVLIPPQANYATAGNVGLDRYFLYPRLLSSGTLDNVSTKGYEYVLINPGWPKEKIVAENILLLGRDNGTNKLYENYDPEKIKDYWGIIKLKQ